MVEGMTITKPALLYGSQNTKQNSAQDIGETIQRTNGQPSSTERIVRVSVSQEPYNERPLQEPLRGTKHSEILLPTFIEIV